MNNPYVDDLKRFANLVPKRRVEPTVQPTTPLAAIEQPITQHTVIEQPAAALSKKKITRKRSVKSKLDITPLTDSDFKEIENTVGKIFDTALNEKQHLVERTYAPPLFLISRDDRGDTIQCIESHIHVMTTLAESPALTIHCPTCVHLRGVKFRYAVENALDAVIQHTSGDMFQLRFMDSANTPHTIDILLSDKNKSQPLYFEINPDKLTLAYRYIKRILSKYTLSKIHAYRLDKL